MIKSDAHLGFGQLSIEWFPFIKWDPVNFIYYVDETEANEFFRGLLHEGINTIRVMPYGVWQDFEEGFIHQFRPFKFVKESNNWTVKQFNQNYFDVMKRVFEIAKNPYPYPVPEAEGCHIVFEVHDQCQYHGPYRVKSSWHNNVEGLGINEIWMPEHYHYMVDFITECYKQFGHLVDEWGYGNETVDIELCIQCIAPTLKKLLQADTTRTRPAYEYLNFGCTMDSQQFQWIKARTHSDVFPEYDEDTVKGCVRRPNHGWASKMSSQYPLGPTYENDYSWLPGNPLCCFDGEDDGTWDADSECDVAPGTTQRRPSSITWNKMVYRMLAATAAANNLINPRSGQRRVMFMHLPKNLADWECQKKTIRGMVQGYAAALGKAPVNQGKYPKLPGLKEFTMAGCVSEIKKGGSFILNTTLIDETGTEIFDRKIVWEVSGGTYKCKDNNCKAIDFVAGEQLGDFVITAIVPKSAWNQEMRVSCSFKIVQGNCWAYLWRWDFRRWFKCIFGIGK